MAFSEMCVFNEIKKKIFVQQSSIIEVCRHNLPSLIEMKWTIELTLKSITDDQQCPLWL